MAKRTREQLNHLRKVVGGSMVAVGLVILALCVTLSLTSLPLVIIGIVLVGVGAIIAASMTVFEAIIQLVSSL